MATADRLLPSATPTPVELQQEHISAIGYLQCRTKHMQSEHTAVLQWSLREYSANVKSFDV